MLLIASHPKTDVEATPCRSHGLRLSDSVTTVVAVHQVDDVIVGSEIEAGRDDVVRRALDRVAAGRDPVAADEDSLSA